MITYSCPKCGSDRVTLAHIQMFMANTGEHYCHSVKTHDSNAPASCLDCYWDGENSQLVTKEASNAG